MVLRPLDIVHPCSIGRDAPVCISATSAKSDTSGTNFVMLILQLEKMQIL